MAPRLKILLDVAERLCDVNSTAVGGLYGIMYDGTLLVLGFSLDANNGEAYLEMQSHFPTEVDFCGLVTIVEQFTQELPQAVTADLKEVLVTDNPLLVQRELVSGKIKAYFLRDGQPLEAQFDLLTEQEVFNLFVVLRLRTHLQLSSHLSIAAIQEEVNTLQKKVSTGAVLFHVSNANVYLFGTESDGEGIKGTVGDLFESSLAARGGFIEEDSNYKAKKKCTGERLCTLDVMQVAMLMCYTRNTISEGDTSCAPVIHHIKRCGNHLKVNLPIDVLSLVHKGRPTAELYNILVDALCRALRLAQRSLSSAEVPATPRPYHYAPPTLGHFFTLVYLDNKPDCENVEARKLYHKQLCLPMDWPLLRRGNVHLFKEDVLTNAPLVNVHEGLLPSGVKEGQVYIVKGRYSYHHYMQDKTDDNGWGCAYRSLQTVVSWLRWQGLTEQPVPSHREIQQCLVNLGDKPGSFVGSRQWIGSTEVAYCLDSLYNVTCRLLNVSSGLELADCGSQLAHHFATHATPIMIGGGVLAHTILGVDFNRDTGELKFLVLDPHYTGTEDLKLIQTKGWVGWKSPDFWVKNAFYNLCMPLRPHCI